MERLTKTTEIGNAYFPKCFEEPCCGMGKCIDNNCNLVNEVCKKLAEYETLEEQGLLVRLPCKVKDTIWELCLCSDGNYRIFPMIVKSISKYGTLRQVEKGTTIWHIYAESDYTYVYKNFTDLGKTVFLTREEAEKKLWEMKK